MNVLVTGGSGFIGRNIVRTLKERGETVGTLDLSQKSPGSDYHFTCDVRNSKKVEKALKGVDLVFHLAAVTSPPEFENLMGAGFEVNVMGTYNILAASHTNKVKRVVLASSSSIYGDIPKAASEDKLPETYMNFYPLSKRINEQTASLFKNYEVETVKLRFFNTYGIGENTKGSYSSVIWKFIESIRKGQKPVIFGDGKQSRDFVYVKDVARGSVQASEKGKAGESYNIGSGRSVDFNSIFSIVKREMGYEGEAEYVKNPLKSYQQFTLADISKSRRVLDYSPKYDIKNGVRDILDSI